MHAEDSDGPTDEGSDDDADNDRHAAITDCRQDLSCNDAADCTVSNHDDHIQYTRNLSRPISHEVSGYDLWGAT
jgi:hypothetical protein